MRIVTVDEMRDLERRSAAEGVTTDALMERAGLAVARVAWREMDSRPGTRALVLVGPGNNGGDGLVAARHLQAWGAHVTAYLCGPRPPEDLKAHPARAAGVQVAAANDDLALTGLRRLMGDARLVVDAVLGTGKARPIAGPLSAMLAALREERILRPDLKLLALDLPTGLDADTGEADPACPAADVTVTLGCPKAGLLRFPGAAKVGRLVVADIGIPLHLTQDPSLDLMTPRWARGVLPQRPRNAHKGTFGRALVVAGSPAYIGAAYLACMGVARAGAGYVTLAVSPSIHPILAAKLTEATYLLLPEEDSDGFPQEAAQRIREGARDCDVLLLGCGLGQRAPTEALVRQLLHSSPALDIPLVLDADGLNLLAGIPGWWGRLKAPAVVTPHPGEMARLLGEKVERVEEDRVEVARAAAARWGVTVLLKGAFTVVASPQGRVRVSPFANPALATAGTGDVLAGVVASLVAQGLSPFDAAGAGVFLHAAAGELVAREVGPAGAIASDLLPRLPLALRALREGSFSDGVDEEP